MLPTSIVSEASRGTCLDLLTLHHNILHFCFLPKRSQTFDFIFSVDDHRCPEFFQLNGLRAQLIALGQREGRVDSLLSVAS